MITNNASITEIYVFFCPNAVFRQTYLRRGKQKDEKKKISERKMDSEPRRKKTPRKKSLQLPACEKDVLPSTGKKAARGLIINRSVNRRHMTHVQHRAPSRSRTPANDGFDRHCLIIAFHPDFSARTIIFTTTFRKCVICYT